MQQNPSLAFKQSYYVEQKRRVGPS
uniref:Uncharacterized protein n=1 Tax=Arundo donax TaxID=35708 RepID=A0A0A8YHS2_ARUDO